MAHMPYAVCLKLPDAPTLQILNNLLGNAAKFTHRGNIRVSARHYEESNKVAISVHDTGIGIPKYKLQSIFLPFEQVSHFFPALQMLLAA